MKIAIYELVKVTQGTTTTESYTYDAVGNRLSSATVSSYTYNSSNELTSVAGTTFSYDNNGNTTSRTFNGATTTISWDFENRSSQVVLPGTGGTVSFKYDPFGRRIEKISPTVGTTIFAYDGDNRIEDLNTSGTATARYTQGLGIDEPLMGFGSGTSYYSHADGLGSITTLTTSSGSVATSHVYDSFGNTTATTGTAPNPFRYTGREFDSETGAYYYRGRYYCPSTGRFFSEDPSQFARGVSLYTYVFNDPANQVDPSGLAECFYRISTHTLQCVFRANIKSPPIVVGPKSVSSGLGRCRDEPACTALRDIGPIVPGEYRMNRDRRPGQEGIYRLEPIPTIPWWQYYSGLKRGGFVLHPGTRTVGCINVLKTDPSAMDQYDRLRKLLEAEDGKNYLLVAP